MDGLKSVFKALVNPSKPIAYVPGRTIVPSSKPTVAPFAGSPDMDEALIKKLSAARNPHANVPFESE